MRTLKQFTPSKTMSHEKLHIIQPEAQVSRSTSNSRTNLNFRKLFHNISQNLNTQNGDQLQQSSQNFRPKLPALTYLLNAKNDDLDQTLYEEIVQMYRYSQELEELVKSKNKEITRLEYLNKYLVIAQQKRDEMLSYALEENRKLKELTLVYERRLNEKSNQRIQPINNSKNNTQLINSNLLNGIPSSNQIPNSINKNLSRPLKSSAPNKIKPIEVSNVNMQLSRKSIQKNIFPNKNDDLRQRKASILKTEFISFNQSRPGGNKNKLIDDKKSQSILKMTSSEAMNLFNENESLIFLENILKEDEEFIQTLQSLDASQIIQFYDAISNIKENYKSLFHLVFRLKKLINSANSMNTSLVLYEALEKIVDETCECLDCDRATVFMVDHLKEELWSKVARGSDNTIRIPMRKGIVGHVATTGKPQNILNAYQDERFNKDIDLRTNYKTNTILCVPIIEEGTRVIGVIQAINKLDGVFDKDDEELLMILANLASVVLRNSMNFDQQILFHNNLRHCLRAGIYLNSFFGLNKLIPQAEKKLQSIMGVDKGIIYVVENEKDRIIRYQDEDSALIYPKSFGLVGKSLQNRQILNLTNSYSDPEFNGRVDIDTNIPLICMPVKHPNEDSIIAVFQVINKKGLQGLYSTNKSHINPLDLELLEFFAKQLAQSILNNINWHIAIGQPLHTEIISN